MNYTENYQLPQWEETDRVLRKDFNAAMEKVDTQLSELEVHNPVVKLLDLVVEQAANLIDIDVQEIDFFSYRRLEMDAKIPFERNSLYIRLNGFESGYNGHNSSHAGTLDSDCFAQVGSLCFCMLARPWKGEQVGCFNPRWSQYGYTDWYCTAPVLWEELKTIHLWAGNGGTIPVGTKFQLFGIKG